MVPVLKGLFHKGIFPDIRSLLNVRNFRNTISPTQTVRPSQPVTYNIPSPFPQYALQSAHNRAIVLRSAKVSQSESFIWRVNWAASCCTRSNAFICLSLHGSQHADPYSRTELSMTCRLNCYIPISLFHNTHHKVKCLPGLLHCLIYLVHPA